MKNKLILLTVLNFFSLGHVLAMDLNKEFETLPLQSGQLSTNGNEKVNFMKKFTEKCNNDEDKVCVALLCISGAVGRNVDDNFLASALYDIYCSNEDYKDLGSEGFISYMLDDQNTLIKFVSDRENFIKYFLEKFNELNFFLKTASMYFIRPIITAKFGSYDDRFLGEFLYMMCYDDSEYRANGYKKSIDDIFGSIDGFTKNILNLIRPNNSRS